VLANVLGNAAKYTKDAAVRRITIRVRDLPGRARVEVEDTGPGIPAGLEQSIFQPYVRAPGVTAPGLGLGLATVQRFVDRHHGEAGVRSTENGALFWFELPLARGSNGPESERPVLEG
jgi:signal transduction histidine kinase